MESWIEKYRKNLENYYCPKCDEVADPKGYQSQLEQYYCPGCTLKISKKDIEKEVCPDCKRGIGMSETQPGYRTALTINHILHQLPGKTILLFPVAIGVVLLAYIFSNLSIKLPLLALLFIIVFFSRTLPSFIWGIEVHNFIVFGIAFVFGFLPAMIFYILNTIPVFITAKFHGKYYLYSGRYLTIFNSVNLLFIILLATIGSIFSEFVLSNLVLYGIASVITANYILPCALLKRCQSTSSIGFIATILGISINFYLFQFTGQRFIFLLQDVLL